jgi:signal peptidase I
MVNKLRTPQRFDVVAYRAAIHRSNAIWLKRIVGMPGETVVLDDGALFIDGAKMTPPQWVPPIHFGQFPNGLRSKFGTASQPCTLGPGEYFAIGDNQMFSLDSRMEGPVRKESIVGVAELIYWPLSRVRTFR